MFIKSVIIGLLFSVFAQDSTYYVTTSGSDTTTCGAKATPCATINQVITNYPGSCTVYIAAGSYTTLPIALQNGAFVIFQGSGNTTILALWSSDSFISLGRVSGFEFHDLALNFSGGGSDFTLLNGAGNVAGFYNIVLTYAAGSVAGFVSMNGGGLAIKNLTFNQATFDSYFILDNSEGDDSNISIVGSAFSNLSIQEDGGFLVFDAYGAANITLDSTSFNEISDYYVFIGFWAEDFNQTVTISNNAFNNCSGYLPNVYAENDLQCVIDIQNTTWNNASSDFVSGALEVIGYDDGQDHRNITLNNLTFTNCITTFLNNYAGAVLVAFNSLILSNSNFANNSGAYASDVVQGLDTYSRKDVYNITNCYSSSALPKAVIWNMSDVSLIDISDQFPDPSRNAKVVRSLDRNNLSVSPKFGRKIRKNF